MKKIIFLIALSYAASSCQTPLKSTNRDPAADSANKEMKSKDFRKYFKNVNAEERKNIISKSRVLDEKYNPETNKTINVIEDFHKQCGENFKYEKITTTKGKSSIKWPRVECTYHPDDGGLSGATAKFLCDFADASKKDGNVTRKVKYSRIGTNPVEKSEVVESTLASTLARLAGLHADTYCLAEVVCKNCPSQSPWESQASSAPASDKDYTFPITMIEYPLKGYTVTEPGPHPKPQGMHWDELKIIDGGELSQQLRIEREAWMLWVGFVQHWDAEIFNQRILCTEAAIDSNNNPFCEKSIIYTHDYGRSFYRNFQFTLWAWTQPLKQDTKGCYSNFGKMIFNGNPGPGLVQFPHISAEARDLLADRLSRLTDQQITDAFQYVRGEEFLDIPSEKFVKAFKNKVIQLKEVDCLPFSSGKSALAK